MVHCGVQLSELPERARICLSAMLREQSTAAAVARCSRAMRDFVRDYVGEATALDLSGRRDAVAILDAMPADRARNLRDLKLQFCGKAVGTGGDLPRVLARFPSLAVLNLNGCSEVVPESLAAVGSAALTSLSLYWVPKLTDECVTRIVRASSNLRHLNLSGAKLLTNSAVAEIARSLPDLEELDLSTFCEPASLVYVDGALFSKGRSTDGFVAGGTVKVVQAIDVLQQLCVPEFHRCWRDVAIALLYKVASRGPMRQPVFD